MDRSEFAPAAGPAGDGAQAQPPAAAAAAPTQPHGLQQAPAPAQQQQQPVGPQGYGQQQAASVGATGQWQSPASPAPIMMPGPSWQTQQAAQPQSMMQAGPAATAWQSQAPMMQQAGPSWQTQQPPAVMQAGPAGPATAWQSQAPHLMQPGPSWQSHAPSSLMQAGPSWQSTSNVQGLLSKQAWHFHSGDSSIKGKNAVKWVNVQDECSICNTFSMDLKMFVNCYHHPYCADCVRRTSAEHHSRVWCPHCRMSQSSVISIFRAAPSP